MPASAGLTSITRPSSAVSASPMGQSAKIVENLLLDGASPAMDQERTAKVTAVSGLCCGL